MQQVTECSYCKGTYPHQSPTGCRTLPWPRTPDRNCIHPHTFATKQTDEYPPGKAYEHCWTCDRDIPITEL